MGVDVMGKFDVAQFILDNLRAAWPVRRVLAARFGRDGVNEDEVRNIFFIHALPRVRKADERTRNAPKEEREQALHGALKFAAREAKRAIANCYHPMETRILDCGLVPQRDDSVDEGVGEDVFFAAADADVLQSPEAHDRELSERAECLRPHMTVRQYEMFRMAVVDRLTRDEIARRTGTSVGNVEILLRFARKRIAATFGANLQEPSDIVGQSAHAA